MHHNIKQINIKNRPCYLFNDMANIKNFDPNKLSFRGVLSVNIYYIKYITMKSIDLVNIDNEDFLYLIFNNVDGYIDILLTFIIYIPYFYR